MELSKEIENYLVYCKRNKGLSDKTIKAYRIDLNQFLSYSNNAGSDMTFGKQMLVEYISTMSVYKPKTQKRKIAALKAFCSYLECEEIIEYTPFHKIRTKFKEPVLLPKTIQIGTINKLFKYMYKSIEGKNKNSKQYVFLLRDIVAIEMLFCTGARISEICSLKRENIVWTDVSIKIYGKGSRERVVYIGNSDVIKILKRYFDLTKDNANDYLFVNRLGNRLSEQSLRFAIYKYIKAAGISQHITPHMFRHSFATMMLDENVDIRYIQNILGHSSITTTQIYTHVSIAKQKEIMLKNNPRNGLKF